MTWKKSDQDIVPMTERKRSRTQVQGKVKTEKQEVKQLSLFDFIADARQEDTVQGLSHQMTACEQVALKKSKETKAELPTVTMEAVAATSNMEVALKQVIANKGGPGIDKQSVDEVKTCSAKLLPIVQQALLDGSYEPGQIRRVWIPKSGGGQRGLGIPNVIDRWVQQALNQILTPRYEPQFHDNSHGFRPGRGCHTAIAQAKSYIENGYTTVVDIDLEKFFDRVNHERLMSTLRKDIQDSRVLRVIHQMLKAQTVLPDGVVVNTEEGVPQGGPLSPLLSNIVLNELDWELERRGHKFVRYADDCNIYVRSQRAGERVLKSLDAFISRKLRLKINKSKSAVGDPITRHFLGFSVGCDPITESVEVRFSKPTLIKINRDISESCG